MMAFPSLSNIGHRLRIFALLSLATILAACGGDGINTVPTPEPSEPEPPAETVENMISGSVIKGPVSGSVVIVYEFDGTTEIGRGETAEDGSFTISIGENAGGVVISASGGTYTDEATGAENVQFGSVEMRAAYMIPESMTPPFEATINVTPFTELAVREATVDGAIDAQILATVNEDFFDLGDNAINILTTLPTNPLTDSVSEGTAEDLYGLYLAMISQIVSDQGFGSWDEAVDILEVTENADAILSAALNALASSDTAAGANITLEAALSALEAIADAATDGGDGDDGSDTGDGTDGSDGSAGGSGGSGAMPCVVGEGAATTVPSGLAGTVGDLTLTFVAASSPLTQGTVTNFTFSSSGLLFIDNSQAATTPYLCGGNSAEVLWFDEGNDRVYAVSFRSDGSFNEVNVNSGDGTFLGQYTDENGDFANVTNTGDSSSGGDSSNGGEGGIDGGSSGTGDFTLTITGTVAVSTSGVSVGVDIPEITINNIAAPNPDDDFKALLEESDFNVTSEVTVTTINNTENRVTFKLEFEGLNAGIASTYDVTYDYQK